LSFVNVGLFSTLRKYCSDREVGEPMKVELVADMTIAELIDRLGIPAKEVFITTINGYVVKRSHGLRNGDNVSLYGIVVGG